MQLFRLIPLIVCLTTALPNFVPAQTAPATSPVLEAEILRKTTGRQIDNSGFATRPYQINKGEVFDVVSQELADVVLTKRGVRVRLPKTDVRLYEKAPDAPTAIAPVRPQDPRMSPMDPRAREAAAAEAAKAAEAAALAAFDPGGQLVIISARYSLPGNSPRNVKTKLEKLIPSGLLTAPVRIIVSDELSRAAANQPDFVVIESRTSTTVVETAKNVLTVQYMYKGKSQTKQAVEGSTLFLP